MELEMPTQKLDRAGTKITIISNGDIFKSQCEALVNPVNTKGVMGKGTTKTIGTTNIFICLEASLQTSLYSFKDQKCKYITNIHLQKNKISL